MDKGEMKYKKINIFNNYFIYFLYLLKNNIDLIHLHIYAFLSQVFLSIILHLLAIITSLKISSHFSFYTIEK